jgi:hypothetical protein
MGRDTPQQQRSNFVATVLGAEIPIHSRPHAVELKVRVVKGSLALGPARLVSPSGTIHDITVLGVSLVHYREPTALDPMVIYVGIKGVTISDVESGLMLLQDEEILKNQETSGED